MYKTNRKNMLQKLNEIAIPKTQMGLKLTCVNQTCLVVSRTEKSLLPTRASSGNTCNVDGQKTCSSAMNFENRMGMKLTCVDQIKIAVSRTEKYLIPSRALSGNTCHVDGQKTCSSAMNFENRIEMKLACVNQLHFVVSRTEQYLMPSRASLMSSRACDCHSLLHIFKVLGGPSLPKIKMPC
jgi:hypothetical protein